MQLTISSYPDVYLSESGSAQGILSAPVDPARPRGNVRKHAKALFKGNKVEHNISYLYNPPKLTKPVGDTALKSLVARVADRLQLSCSIKHSMNVTERSDGQINFAFTAFGFDENLVLKMVSEFDEIMMEHGWDSLIITLTKLDGSVERVDFKMRNTPRYSGMKYNLNSKLI